MLEHTTPPHSWTNYHGPYMSWIPCQFDNIYVLLNLDQLFGRRSKNIYSLSFGLDGRTLNLRLAFLISKLNPYLSPKLS